MAAFSFFALISLNSSLSETAPGRILLLAMLGMNLYFVTWGGALLFAPVIAEEKEAGTLGLCSITLHLVAQVVLCHDFDFAFVALESLDSHSGNRSHSCGDLPRCSNLRTDDVRVHGPSESAIPDCGV